MADNESMTADVLVVGAGPAGLALAAALGDLGLRITLFEQQPLAALQEPAEDGREIALTHRTRRVMTALGLWAHLDESDVSPLNKAHVIDGGSPLVLHFGQRSGPDEGPLGWLVPNHRIRHAAWQAAHERAGVQVITQARVVGIERSAQRAQLRLDDGRQFTGRLLVAADSRFSSIRRLAGIGAAMHDFGRSVVVGRVRHEHDNAGVAWECFRYGNTLAMLPLNDRVCSAVVTVGSERAEEWLALSDASFAARIQQQTEGRLGLMQAAGPRHHYPLVGVYAQRFAAPRLVLIGDAAVGMHPVTAHGWNFGIYGVELLARELGLVQRRGGDIGDLAPLRAYERRHRLHTLPVWTGTNAIVSLFTSEQPVPRLARRAVLALSEHAPGLSGVIKAGIEYQLTGGRKARALRP
ncbi:MAG: 5-demethoxyubiquinol-8 5-hydroxylase UbiM [Rubrivivax sp.]|nr:5-demethoxyubiquinol-8 5-hydroxylase UbiM [Rubrivivax sp.]